MSKLPETHWRSQPNESPVWEKLGIPKSDLNTIDHFCPHCSYHTAWVRDKSWTVCGWCFESVGFNADFHKNGYDAYTRSSQILEIKKAIADAELQGINLKNKIAATVRQCGDRDKLLYQSWEFLPNEDHARMLAGIQDLIKLKVDDE